MVTGMAIGKTVGGPRAEKEEGWSEVGVRDLTAEGEGEGGSISAHQWEEKGVIETYGGRRDNMKGLTTDL